MRVAVSNYVAELSINKSLTTEPNIPFKDFSPEKYLHTKPTYTSILSYFKIARRYPVF